MTRKKTYIPSKPRNPKLGIATGTSGVGKTEFNQVAGSSHEHYNKGVLDQITEAMLVGALRDLITSTDTETELTDENILSSLRVLSEIAKNNEAFLEDLKNRFLSKIEPDTAQSLITFIEGVEVGAFTTGALGSGAAVKMIDGTSYAEVDNLTVRQKATFRELIIEALKHIGGQLVLSPARMKCNKVVDGGTYYKCYFDTGDGEVSNEFVAGDQARCQVFTGSGTKFYWRLVTSVGEDWINLSKTDAVAGSDAPASGDDISQLGNRTDVTRQSAIILSTVGADAPSWKQYSGINSFDLANKETTVFTRLGNRIQGKTVFTSDGANLDDYLDSTAQDIEDAQAAANAAALKAQQAIAEAEANVTLINTEVGKLQEQLDGEVSNWFYAYSPTLANYPASDWTTNEIKDRHVGDTFTNTAQAPATDAGKSWRFVKNGSTYSWTVIADSDAVKALLEASKAQATADGKSTTHLFQPTKYKLGDMWVLNADQTVNGTAYKSGEILTATQDSETFVQAHWVKRVRYTDDSAVNNLEIGTRNLFAASRTNRTAITNSKEFTEIFYGNAIFNNATVLDMFSPSTQYTIQYEVEIISKPTGVSLTQAHGGFRLYTPTAITILAGISHSQYENSSVGDVFKLKRTFTTPADLTNYTLVGYTAWIPSDNRSATMTFRNLKIEKGTKATDWSPAPEDVQADIDSAKQEALTASNNVQTNVDSLNTYMDGAFKDGVIDEAEAKAIEKYLNTINETMAKAEASFLKVFANTYLEGTAKTALENAKINLWGQRDTLLTAINTAIAGGTTTPAQKTAVDNAFSLFNSLMSAFQSALEEANKAIQVKLDAISKGYVDELEIGGRNLFEWNKISYSGTYWELSNEPYELKSKLAISSISTFYVGSFMEVGEQYTISFEIKASASGIAWENSTLYLDSANVTTHNRPTLTPDKYVRVQKTFTWKGGGTGRMHIYISGLNTTTNYVLLRNIQIEKGNKPTDWTEAPEDVDKKISDVDAKAIEALAKANISKAITDKFGTSVNGGLINTVTVELREADTQDVTAGHTGIQGHLKNLPAYWAGGTYAEALAGLAGIILRHDGTGKIGVFEVDEAGSVNIYDPDIADLLRLEFIKSKVPTVASLMGQTQAEDSVTNAARMFYSSSGSATLPNSVTVTEEGAELSFQGMMELDVSFTELNGAEFGSAAVGVYLYKDGSNYATLGGISAGRIDRDNPYFSSFVQLSKKLTVQKGIYTIVVSGSFSNALGSAGINNTSTLSWILRRDIRRFIFGSDGFASWYTENSFHFSELTGMFARGKVDIPAGLGGGNSSAGGTSGRWGMVTGATRSSSTTTITHSVGDLKYTVMVTPSGSSATWYMQNKTASSVQIVCSGTFDYILVRTPY